MTSPQEDAELRDILNHLLTNVSRYDDWVGKGVELLKARDAAKEREIRIATAEEISQLFETHLWDPTGSMGFDEHVSRRSDDEIERAMQYNHNHAWAAMSAKGKVDEFIATLANPQQQDKEEE